VKRTNVCGLAVFVSMLACQPIEDDGGPLEVGLDGGEGGGAAGGRDGGSGGGQAGGNVGGGQAGGSRDAGPETDGPPVIGVEEPDAMPDCAPLPVDLRLSDDAPIARGEVAEITFTMPEGGGARATPVDGGIITPRNGGRFLYSPGGALRGHLPWPWTSGPTGIDVEVWDARGCRGNARIDVQVHGDVLVANGSTGGGLVAFGSDGSALGLWRPIGAGQGVRGFVRLPDAAGGGLAAVLRRSNGLEPAIRTYDANGSALVDFAMVAPTGEPVYDPDNAAEPKHLLYVATGEVLGDGGLNEEIHRWTVDGEYKGIFQLPLDAGFGSDTLGFARFPDGRVVVGTSGGRALYAFDPSRFATNDRVISLTDEHLFLTLEEPPIALGDTLGEDVMVVSGRGNSNDYTSSRRKGPCQARSSTPRKRLPDNPGRFELRGVCQRRLRDRAQRRPLDTVAMDLLARAEPRLGDRHLVARRAPLESVTAPWNLCGRLWCSDSSRASRSSSRSRARDTSSSRVTCSDRPMTRASSSTS
jgi:hypothetical protein